MLDRSPANLVCLHNIFCVGQVQINTCVYEQYFVCCTCPLMLYFFCFCVVQVPAYLLFLCNCWCVEQVSSQSRVFAQAQPIFCFCVVQVPAYLLFLCNIWCVEQVSSQSCVFAQYLVVGQVRSQYCVYVQHFVCCTGPSLFLFFVCAIFGVLYRSPDNLLWFEEDIYTWSWTAAVLKRKGWETNV